VKYQQNLSHGLGATRTGQLTALCILSYTRISMVLSSHFLIRLLVKSRTDRQTHSLNNIFDKVHVRDAQPVAGRT